MKRIWKDILKAAVIGFLIPAALLIVVIAQDDNAEIPEETKPSQSHSQATQPTASASTKPPQKPALCISVLSDQQVVEMPLEEYVVGVVLAEVPASFAMEALKAQAVASRTYALCACEGNRHSGSDICTSYTCCQAYISPETYLAAGGSEDNLQKIRRAVEETAGQVLTYQGSLICATYFSCSGGSTEDAVAVWGTDVPYLQAVESPGEEFAAVYTDSYVFTAEEFQTALCIRLDGAPDAWFGEVVYTEGGGVATMEIGGVAYRGTTLRTLLGLRSTAFTLRVADGGIYIETLGYGHRVGMSQYGAEAMAVAGSDYAEILAHYYLGTSLSEYPME